jgi:thiamine biosynthesis protein ThiS
VERLGADLVRIVTISVNGKNTDTGGAVTIADLIQRYQLAPQAVLIEHNGVALHRREWAQKKLSDGDRIEFIRVVAGG